MHTNTIALIIEVLKKSGMISPFDMRQIEMTFERDSTPQEPKFDPDFDEDAAQHAYDKARGGGCGYCDGEEPGSSPLCVCRKST